MKQPIPEFHNIQLVKRDSDQSVTVVFASCRSASAFEVALMGALEEANVVPVTSLKSAGMIDLFDEGEPGNKETVPFGLLLEFPTREAMAEAFEKGICRYSFDFRERAPAESEEPDHG